jgi:hypothetical protein
MIAAYSAGEIAISRAWPPGFSMSSMGLTSISPCRFAQRSACWMLRPKPFLVLVGRQSSIDG